MKLQLEKSMRIVSDLVTFCHTAGAQEYSISLKQQDGISRIELRSPIAALRNDSLEVLRDALALPRQHEVEQNYWELSGDSEMENELTLVGMMLDEASADYTDGVLTIKAQRKD